MLKFDLLQNYQTFHNKYLEHINRKFVEKIPTNLLLLKGKYIRLYNINVYNNKEFKIWTKTLLSLEL